MKTIEKKQSLRDNIRTILLSMSVDSVEHYHASNMNHNTLKVTYNRVRKHLVEEGLGDWMSKYDDELFIIVRIK